MKEEYINNQIEKEKGEEKTRLSIIIPVYNAEATLPRCLDSIISQVAGGGVEIICVNDGSKDGSLDVLRQYERKHPHIIHVIDQENKGVSAARNAALDIARGEYVTCVDADDYILPNVLTPAIKQACDKDCDIIFFGFVRKARSGKEVKDVHPEKRYSQGERLKLLGDIRGQSFVVAWGKFFKKSIIGDTRYDVKMRTSEDDCFNYDLLVKCRNTYVSSLVLYFYEVNYSNATAAYRRDQDLSDLCTLRNKFENTIYKLLCAEDNVSIADKQTTYDQLKENFQVSVSYRSLFLFYSLYRSDMNGKYSEAKRLLNNLNSQFGKGWEKHLKNRVPGISRRLMQHPFLLHVFLTTVFKAERLKRAIMR